MTLYAWAIDDDFPGDWEDSLCFPGSSFPAAEDSTYDELRAKHIEKQIADGDYDEDDDFDERIRFWLVSEETNAAADAIPIGDWDAKTLENTDLRKTVLKAGLIRELRPPDYDDDECDECDDGDDGDDDSLV